MRAGRIMLQEVAMEVENIASAMAHVGVPAHGRAGIYAVNCPEWMITMQVCICLEFEHWVGV